MKIKIIYCIEGSMYGGGQRAFLQLAQGLNKEKFDISIACEPGTKVHAKLKQGNLRHIPVDFKKLINPYLIWKLTHIFKEERQKPILKQPTGCKKRNPRRKN